MFLGYCNNMPELINLSDIFTLILPFAGGVGLAIMEAMACGKPCVISHTSGTEFFTDGKEVLLVDFDSKDIADKIMLLLKDEDYAREIGINARKRIESECSIKVGGEKLFNKLSEDRLP
jgi:glycosyltransferase involved in cell wall biosynthesis